MIGMRCSTTTSKEHSQRTRAVSLKLYVSYEGLLDRYSRASCWLLVCTHYSCFVQTPNLCETGPDRDVQHHAGVSAGKLKGPVNPNGGGMHHGQNSAVHKIPTTGKIHTQPVLRVCPESTHNSANYTGISTRKLLVVRSPFKVVTLLFFGKSMLFYESSFCSSFLLVLVNLVNARSKDRK